MSRTDDFVPLLDDDRSDTQSLASEAPKNNHDAADGASGLKKRKSWFNSLRDAVQKGALQAKAAVDSFRGDQHKTAAKGDTGSQSSASDSQPRKSIGSKASSTAPLRPYDRRDTVTSQPKSAFSSLRQHLPGHSSRSKRASVYSIGRPSSEMSNLAGPEGLVSPPDQEVDLVVSKRRPSVAENFVGSIRGLGRKHTLGRLPIPPPGLSSDRPAENIPLPSSPIDIPAAAPALELDLGPAGLMSPRFGRSPEKQHRTQNTLKLTDPKNITTARPKSVHDHVPDDVKARVRTPVTTRPVTPSDLLQPGPATPLPGTNMSMELDGANSDASEKSPVFERSVTPPNEKERKELRGMRSLDAMAEACTIAHASDEQKQSTQPEELATDPFGSNASTNAESLQAPGFRRNPTSCSTLSVCPPDMSELSQQETPPPRTPVPGSGNKASDNPFGDDPFASDNEITFGPPSPGQKLQLPVRLKINSQTRVRTNDGDHHSPPEQSHAAFQEEVSTTAPEVLTPTQSLEVQLHLQRSHAVLQGLSEMQVKPRAPESSKGSDMPLSLTSDEDACRRIAEFLTDDIVLPNYDNRSSPCKEDLAARIKSNLSECIDAKQNPSPRSMRSRTTYTAGLGDADYQFSFDKWLRNSTGASAANEVPVTPHRRSMDMSIDSVSITEEHQTPQISPASTNPGHGPSMGSRLEFDLKRSQRNMQYNALHQDTSTKQSEQQSSPLHPRLRFLVGGSDEANAEAYELQLADFESAYASSPQTTPLKEQKSLEQGNRSETSVSDSLKDAVVYNFKLQESLSGLLCQGLDEFSDDSPAVETSPGLPEPPSSDVDQTRLVRSDSPSPEKKPLRQAIIPQDSAGGPSQSQSTPSAVTLAPPSVPGVLASPSNPLSSPDSGYAADDSSMGPNSEEGRKSLRSRYRA